jgi:hypothetical protein
MASTTLPEPSDRTAINALRVPVWCAVAKAIEGGLPSPLNVDVHVFDDYVLLQLRMDNNAPEEVDAWALVAGAEAVAGKTLHDAGRADGPGWRSYKAGGIGAGVKWHGWVFEVWCSVDEPEGGES